MTTFPRALLVVTMLLAAAFAGCMQQGSTDDGGDGANDTSDDGPPPARDKCVYKPCTGRNWSFQGKAWGKEGGGKTGTTTMWWNNSEAYENDTATLYWRVETGTLATTYGDLEFWWYDGDNGLWVHREMGPNGTACNNDGMEAAIGNWTMKIEWKDFQGRFSMRIQDRPLNETCR